MDAVYPSEERGGNVQLHEYTCTRDLTVGEWTFIKDPGNPGYGHGHLKCRNEVSMNMAKLAFASAVRIKDGDGADGIPYMKEVTNEATVADEGTHYTHFFRPPIRLR